MLGPSCQKIIIPLYTLSVVLRWLGLKAYKCSLQGLGSLA